MSEFAAMWLPWSTKLCAVLGCKRERELYNNHRRFCTAHAIEYCNSLAGRLAKVIRIRLTP